MPKLRQRPELKYLGDKKKYRSFYHTLLQLSIPVFILIFFICFLCLNATFAIIYLFSEGLINAIDPTASITFGDSVYFSMTFPVVGYGGIMPTNLGKIIAAFHVFCGLLFLGTLTGIIFARFTQAPSPLVWSKPIVLSTSGDKKCLKLRATNVVGNDVIGVEPSLYLQRSRRDKKGVLHRELIPIKLEQENIPILAFSWVVSHIITDSSPLAHWVGASPPLTERLIGYIHGYDATVNRVVYSYARWSGDELVRGEFEEIITHYEEDASLKLYATINLNGIDQVQPDSQVDSEKGGNFDA